MSLPIYCPTPNAVFLCAMPDARGILHFFSQSVETPGIVFTAQAMVPIQLQLHQAWHELSGLPKPTIDVVQELMLPLQTDAGETHTLYLGRITQPLEPLRNVLTFPQLLRGMEKNRSRLAYLKAWQVLAGTLSEQFKVVETKDL